MIELHIDLFNPHSVLFAPFNQIFQCAFEQADSLEIDSVTIHTLPPNQNLLFLTLHSIKHFLGDGIGIRQICDLVMYCNHYGTFIHWKEYWEYVDNIGFKVLVLNLYEIGFRYLGLDRKMVKITGQCRASDIHPDKLLMDIMQGGIFGSDTHKQVKTASMTMQATLDYKSNSVRRNHMILKAIFPGWNYISSIYPYCRRCKLLLPIAWIYRILKYIMKEKTPAKMLRIARDSFTTGNKRIELLKEYKVIDI
jgi:hypothetical protein